MKRIYLVALAAVAPTVCMAQSKIQCVQGADGQYQAALIWQNTLGVERANAICRMNAPVPVQAVHATSEQKADVATISGSRFDSAVYEKAGQKAASSASPARVTARMEPTPKQPESKAPAQTQEGVSSDYVQMW